MLGLSVATIASFLFSQLNRFNECDEYNVLACIRIDVDDIYLSKTRIDFANEVFGGEVCGGGRMEDGRATGRVCWVEEDGGNWGEIIFGGLGVERRQVHNLEEGRQQVPFQQLFEIETEF